MKKIVTPTLAPMLLTDCNSEPSNTDISQAMQSPMSEMHGTPNSSKRFARKDRGSDGSYLYSVELDAKLPIVGRRELTPELKFIRSDGSWKTMTLSR